MKHSIAITKRLAVAIFLLAAFRVHAHSAVESNETDKDAVEIERELSESHNIVPLLDLIKPSAVPMNGASLQIDEPQLSVLPEAPTVPEPEGEKIVIDEPEPNSTAGNGENAPPDLVISSQADDVSIQILRTQVPAAAAVQAVVPTEPPKATAEANGENLNAPADSQEVATVEKKEAAPKEFKVHLTPDKNHHAGKNRKSPREPASFDLDSVE